MGNARARKIPAQLVCTRLPPARNGGRRASRLEEVPATAREILALAGRLLAGRVELVVMEATSDYVRSEGA